MTNGAEIYFIGGAPCGGKSTAARAICARYGFRAFELDRNLERYTHLGMLDGNALLRAAAIAAPQDINALPPCRQCRQELEIYRQLFPYALRELLAMEPGAPILADGAGFLPELMQQAGVDAGHYVCLIPEPSFQRARYRERPWAAQLIAQTPEPEKTFDRWMARSALLGREIRAQARQLGYACITTGAGSTPAGTLRQVEAALRLDAKKI